MTNFNVLPLLAKGLSKNSQTPKEATKNATLFAHTINVVLATRYLCHIVGVSKECQRVAELAAFLHDLGKANDHFQSAVRHQTDAKQILRHEFVSGVIAWYLKPWLMQSYSEQEYAAALVAAASHHLKLNQEDRFGELRDRMSFYLLTEHKDFKKLTNWWSKWNQQPTLMTYPQAKSYTQNDLIELQRTIGRFKNKAQFIKEIKQVKSLLIAADAIGSAFCTTGKPQSVIDTIKGLFKGSYLTREDVSSIIETRLQGGKPRDFQLSLGKTTTRVTLVEAGCGTGKTLGAYYWAKTHAIDKKLIFCYPTTGTATEGFLDYLHGNINAFLCHSRAEIDLDILTTNEPNSELGETDPVNLIYAQLSAFESWTSKVIACTVDTVLGLIAHSRKSHYMSPTIFQSAIVFDEVHSYDDRMFLALLEFMKSYPTLPILLMSASVLPWQKEAITSLLNNMGETLTCLGTSCDKPRYRLSLNGNPFDGLANHKESKVLWVCNTVKEAVETYKKLEQMGFNCLLYHSRFRYKDRVKHHKEVISAFGKPGGFVAVTTQVAEMSLDLSADLLVSQLAPPASLIQRLGRLNRKYTNSVKEAVFYKPSFSLPYKEDGISAGLTMIQNLQGKDISQLDLSNWLKSNANPKKLEINLFPSDEFTYSVQVREDGYTIDALLERDVAIVQECKNTRGNWVALKKAFLVPIPVPKKKKDDLFNNSLKTYIALDKDWEYTEKWGASEKGCRQ